MEKKTIGQRIKELRIEKGLSQEELATKLGYKSRSTINKIELGINDITQTKIVEFAKIFEISPSFLMGWEETAYYDDKNTVVVYLKSGKRLTYRYLSTDETGNLLDLLDTFSKQEEQ